MSCTCHINPPCSYCEALYECDACGEICHPESDGKTTEDGIACCDKCVDFPPLS